GRAAASVQDAIRSRILQRGPDRLRADRARSHADDLCVRAQAGVHGYASDGGIFPALRFRPLDATGDQDRVGYGAAGQPGIERCDWWWRAKGTNGTYGWACAVV